ncbi:hypothetical protein [Cupriavidus sp. BIC8F]|uniref:hypothetical protein n=1 Tax=Cupriavidus sp. BIC8F TaxID=3079014 RepID=UPI002916E6A5|nr:hypothetical protein [Cupriavidus sp. BIC8F]
MPEEEKKQRISRAWADLLGLSGGVEGQRPSNSRPPSINVTGDGPVIVGNGNVFKIHPNITVVQAGNGLIDIAQKRRILELRDQISGVSRHVDGHEMSPAFLMRRLNTHMGVECYTEIPADQFHKAESYLWRLRGMIDGMAGASTSPSWRDRRIQALLARCKELNCHGWRRSYMRKVFGTASIDDLSNDQVGKLHRAVMSRKAAA